MSVNELAMDNIIDILMKLDDQELLNLCSTNKQFSSICQDERIWEAVVKRKFGPSVQKRRSWYLTYRDLTIPIYAVAFSNRSKSKIIQRLFYSFDSAADFLINISDLSSNINVTNFGYPAIFNHVIMSDVDRMLKNGTINTIYDNVDRYLTLGVPAHYTRGILIAQIGKFISEYISILYNYLQKNPSGWISGDSSLYSITRISVEP